MSAEIVNFVKYRHHRLKEKNKPKPQPPTMTLGALALGWSDDDVSYDDMEEAFKELCKEEGDLK